MHTVPTIDDYGFKLYVPFIHSLITVYLDVIRLEERNINSMFLQVGKQGCYQK